MQKAKDAEEVGKTFGLGVLGYLGSVIEIETVSFPAREAGKGALRVNDTAGSMVKDSMFNAGSASRKTFDIDLYSWDIHVNIIGGAQIDGPSAGLAHNSGCVFRHNRFALEARCGSYR